MRDARRALMVIIRIATVLGLPNILTPAAETQAEGSLTDRPFQHSDAEEGITARINDEPESALRLVFPNQESLP